MKKLLLLILITLSFGMIVSVTYAGVNDPPVGGGINNPDVITLKNPFKGGGDLFVFIKTIINQIILPLGGMLAVLAFIYSGFLYVTAQGNDAKIKKAHMALLYTAIGTAILLGSWAIANALEATIKQL